MEVNGVPNVLVHVFEKQVLVERETLVNNSSNKTVRFCACVWILYLVEIVLSSVVLKRMETASLGLPISFK